MFARGVVHLVVVEYIIVYVCHACNCIYKCVKGKQDYKKSKKEVKSQKQRAEKKNSAIGIQVKKNYHPCTDI
jgi:ribosome-binding protein aMBF1 (putative translation factor)